MGMDHRCLVLSGRLLDGQDPAAVQARMAAAFGMEMAGFRERVFARTPLIIRRGLDPATAEQQAEQLRGMGVEADVWPDDDRLVWLRRDQQVRGPLPEDGLARYAEPGDQWCHDGGQVWFAWEAASVHSVPPPLPAAEPAPAALPEPAPLDAPAVSETWLAHEPPLAEPVAEAQAAPAEVPPAEEALTEETQAEQAPAATALPPPLPPATRPRQRYSVAALAALLLAALALYWHPLSLFALLFGVCALVYLRPRPFLRGRAVAVAALALSVTALVLWVHRPAAVPVAQAYVARPLKPLSNGTGSSVGEACLAHAAAPQNDEDRFLLTGQRLLTGRAQRKGDTYVAEAAVAVNAQCQPSALQLYVFRHGVFIGTVVDSVAGAAPSRLADFDLVDDQHLRVTLAQCTDTASCAATSVRQFAVMPGGGGWTLGEMK